MALLSISRSGPIYRLLLLTQGEWTRFVCDSKGIKYAFPIRCRFISLVIVMPNQYLVVVGGEKCDVITAD